MAAAVPLVGFGYIVYRQRGNEYAWIELDGDTFEQSTFTLAKWLNVQSGKSKNYAPYVKFEYLGTHSELLGRDSQDNHPIPRLSHDSCGCQG